MYVRARTNAWYELELPPPSEGEPGRGGPWLTGPGGAVALDAPGSPAEVRVTETRDFFAYLGEQMGRILR